jgi:hypothetical protein
MYFMQGYQPILELNRRLPLEANLLVSQESPVPLPTLQNPVKFLYDWLVQDMEREKRAFL